MLWDTGHSTPFRGRPRVQTEGVSLFELDTQPCAKTFGGLEGGYRWVGWSAARVPGARGGGPVSLLYSGVLSLPGI